MPAHEATKTSRWTRFRPDRPAKYMPGASLEPRFGLFLEGVLESPPSFSVINLSFLSQGCSSDRIAIYVLSGDD
jgi:hypothetical protein